MSILKIKIEVKDKLEAYEIVSKLGFRYKVLEAEFGGRKESFGKTKKPRDFLKEKKIKTNKKL